ncbi:MAG: acyl-CoA desaturase [Chloroflexota bacterium]|nr:acyl-CoA desaturase [Chloroflexota bacterium]
MKDKGTTSTLAIQAAPDEGLTLNRVTPALPSARINEYAELKRLVKKDGLLEKQPAYYTTRIIIVAGLVALGIVILLTVNNFWLQLLNAVYLAFVFGQIGLLGHEAGHRQMFHTVWKHDLVSLIGGNLLIGMGYSWWLDKHNNHHSHPNQVDLDPDIEIPFLDFTGREDLQSMGKFNQFLVKYQAILFLPALMTVSLGLQANTVRFLLNNKVKYRVLEAGLIIAHFLLYFGVLFYRFPWWQAALFIIIHQALTGLYLGSIFAPNHKGMPVLDTDTPMDFLRRQVLTARNIKSHPLTDFWYGGLNYQIEHHLFPAMPRNKLRAAQGIVRTFCQEHDISYHETGFLQSYKEILQHLYEIGAPLRKS